MIYLDLFLGFLKVGCFAFGGAYGAIPLLRDMVLSNGWLNDETLTYMIAVSESTPGPIMLNFSTYVGSCQAGFLGAVIATLAVVLPSFFIILLVTALLKKTLKNKYVQAVLQGLKPCVMGIILATGIYMVINNCLVTTATLRINLKSIIITFLLVVISVGYKLYAKKKLSPILLIVISSIAGMIVYGV